MSRITLRYNGKFFTCPIEAATAECAFDELLEELQVIGAVKPDTIPAIKKRGYKNSLRPAKKPVVNFMWELAIAAEENEIKVVFSLYDHEGWRFFGRI